MHGIGVRTPSAAAVAAATCGFDILMHMPNGIIFTIGLLSIIFAIGIVVTTLLFGSTINVDGAAPNGQVIIAPPQVQKPTLIHIPFLLETVLSIQLAPETRKSGLDALAFKLARSA